MARAMEANRLLLHFVVHRNIYSNYRLHQLYQPCHWPIVEEKQGNRIRKVVVARASN
jgi:hypothetical protein